MVANHAEQGIEGMSKGESIMHFPRYEKFKQSPSYKGPFIWNNLPATCKNNHHPVMFKRNLRKHLWSLFMERGKVR